MTNLLAARRRRESAHCNPATPPAGAGRPLGPRPRIPPPRRRADRRRRGRRVSVAFMWVPSVWYDEAATVISATRTLGPALADDPAVDIVHADLLRVHARLVRRVPVLADRRCACRAPSSRARRRTRRRAGEHTRRPAHGCRRRPAVLPDPPRDLDGREGRSYAISALLAVAPTLVLVPPVARPGGEPTGRRRALVGRATPSSPSLSVAVFLYLALVIVGARRDHAGAWRWAPRAAPRPRQWRGADAASRPRSPRPHGAPVAARLVRRSRRRRPSRACPLVCSMPSRPARSAGFRRPSFGHDQPGARDAVVLPESSRSRSSGGCWRPRHRRLVVRGSPPAFGAPAARASRLGVVLPWMIVPVHRSRARVWLVATPLYSPRYLTFGTPAVALHDGASAARGRPAGGASSRSCCSARRCCSPPDLHRAAAARGEGLRRLEPGRRPRRRASAPLEPAGTTEGVVFGPVRRHPKATSRIIAEHLPRGVRGHVRLHPRDARGRDRRPVGDPAPARATSSTAPTTSTSSGSSRATSRTGAPASPPTSAAKGFHARRRVAPHPDERAQVQALSPREPRESPRPRNAPRPLCAIWGSATSWGLRAYGERVSR